MAVELKCPPGVTGHSGKANPPEAVFFAPPPPEIGRLRSAYSTLRKDHTNDLSRRWPVLLLIMPVFGLVGASLMDLAGHNLAENIIVGVVAAGLACFLTVRFFSWRFQHACSFVGNRGVAIYRITTSRRAKPREQVHLFENFEDMLISVAQEEFQPDEVLFSFYWTNRPEGLLGRWYEMSFSGNLRIGPGAEPPLSSEYWLARSAADAWNDYLLPKLRDELEKKRAVVFPFHHQRGHLRLEPDSIEVVTDEGVTRLERAELRSIRLFMGRMSINSIHVGEGGPKSPCVDFENVSNLELMFRMTEELLGARAEVTTGIIRAPGGERSGT